MSVLLFKDVKIGDVFFEDVTGEYYQKLNEEHSVVWDFQRSQIYTYRDNNIEHRIEACFPSNHQVEEVGVEK